MKSIIITLIVLFSYQSYSQDISGNYNWNFETKHSSEINLEMINPNEFRGSYCSSYYEGQKIDCNESLDDFCILISRVSPNIFEGTFQSNFSATSGTLKIEYIPSSGSIRVEILIEPEGEYYLPNNVIFE